MRASPRRKDKGESANGWKLADCNVFYNRAAGLQKGDNKLVSGVPDVNITLVPFGHQSHPDLPQGFGLDVIAAVRVWAAVNAGNVVRLGPPKLAGDAILRDARRWGRIGPGGSCGLQNRCGG